MLQGKTVLLGVTGSIAAYKAAQLASDLVKLHADVHVLMTKNALNFIHPITFETLTGHKCLVDTFDRNFEFEVEHISLAKKADAFLIAPASANVIGKIAGGIADDMLTTTLLACTCPILIAPAMNTRMYENPIVQENLEKCKKYGMVIIEPATGLLACKDEGKGKLPPVQMLIEALLKEIRFEKDMQDLNVLVTAGATMESMDPVRFITNHSSGKMGFALAQVAMQRGAKVTLVKANTTAPVPSFVKCVNVKSARDMYEAVRAVAGSMDIIVKAAAVADYTPAEVAGEKMKKKDGELSIPLKRTTDILAYLGQNRRAGQLLCGFSMETEHMLENSAEKLTKKNVDMIVANNVKVEGAGFGTETNVVTLITRSGVTELPLMSKDEVAGRIFDELLQLRSKKQEQEKGLAEEIKKLGDESQETEEIYRGEKKTEEQQEDVTTEQQSEGAPKEA
ncbi:MAG: bifunctional phosphopantothenoylcysteine decarboxylase/phosphopantothenate--cysteine ligase CoaBC [Lachnospiraceae bacterium]|nr:bifunctional phosphopantothenoylcysteine decarboxylase/phosphopantothenate--cysteine ligase CoaBC [Lachnospiraceae bacterium]